MSLALQLHPIQRGVTEWYNDTTCLQVAVDGWSHNVRISEDRKPIPVDYQFDYYSDEGLIHPTDCPNGEELTWMTAGELISVHLISEDNQVITLLP